MCSCEIVQTLSLQSWHFLLFRLIAFKVFRMNILYMMGGVYELLFTYLWKMEGVLLILHIQRKENIVAESFLYDSTLKRYTIEE